MNTLRLLYMAAVATMTFSVVESQSTGVGSWFMSPTRMYGGDCPAWCSARNGELSCPTSTTDNDAALLVLDARLVARAGQNFWQDHGAWIRYGNACPAGYTNWAPAEPSGDSGCVMMWGTISSQSLQFSGGWNDAPCAGGTFQCLCRTIIS